MADKDHGGSYYVFAYINALYIYSIFYWATIDYYCRKYRFLKLIVWQIPSHPKHHRSYSCYKLVASANKSLTALPPSNHHQIIKVFLEI
ncbi:hypothetical protein DID88_006329 [Monilinia fructigena]|uniref:Uncharacterized protein n=1 Tax=Monilinia fructigena TaxID=38457 RepID=A0A395J2D9_9HELO|nr:hypothetical protein DID88_006329 [Monilinia fructigena]